MTLDFDVIRCLKDLSSLCKLLCTNTAIVSEIMDVCVTLTKNIMSQTSLPNLWTLAVGNEP